jgi:hypothetical protein
MAAARVSSSTGSWIAETKQKLLALFQMLGDQGEIWNREKFKKIEGTEFFEFKSFQIRMPCFFLPGNLVVITHGFRKKKDKAPAAEVKRARLIKSEDEAASGTAG